MRSNRNNPRRSGARKTSSGNSESKRSNSSRPSSGRGGKTSRFSDDKKDSFRPKRKFDSEENPKRSKSSKFNSDSKTPRSSESRKDSFRSKSGFTKKDGPKRGNSTRFNSDDNTSRNSDNRKSAFKSKSGFKKRDDSKSGRSPRFFSDNESSGSDRKSSFRPKRDFNKKDEPRRNKPSRFGSDNKSPGSTRDNRGSFERGKKFDKTSPRGRSSKFDKAEPKRYKQDKSVGESLQSGTEQIRLNKYIANSGVCSRREADELIKMGLVTVNDKAITELGYKVNPGDVVKYEGKRLRAEKPIYILLNKPKGYLTTTSDPQERNTVMHIIGNAIKERIYPVGRLDRNTTGLLLLTNDGDLAEKLSHPSYNVKKIYKAELNKPLTKADFQKLLDGVHLEEGKAVVDDVAIVSEDGKTVGLELHIGWNRVVRRIFEALEYDVVKLDRSVYAGLDKKDLPRGHWRYLTREELIHLKHYK